MAGCTHGLGNSFRHFLHSIQSICSPLLIHTTPRSLDGYFIGDNVGNSISNKTTERENRRVRWLAVPTNNLLQTHDDMRCNQYRVNQLVGHSAVPSLSFDGQVEFIGTSHIHAFPEADFPNRYVRCHVLTDHAVD